MAPGTTRVSLCFLFEAGNGKDVVKGSDDDDSHLSLSPASPFNDRNTKVSNLGQVVDFKLIEKKKRKVKAFIHRMYFFFFNTSCKYNAMTQKETFQIEVIFSELLHGKQMDQPMMMVVQSGRNSQKQHEQWLKSSFAVSLSTKLCLTNKILVIKKNRT